MVYTKSTNSVLSKDIWSEQITVLILTYNEEDNIDRTLESLTWAHRILIIDSGSTDKTLEIIRKYPNVSLLKRPFDNFADQCNWGLSFIETEWVLSLDADYIVTEQLVNEIKSSLSSSRYDSYSIPFKYCVFGKPLHGTLLPPRVALYRRAVASYSNDGHAHRVKIEGTRSTLLNPILHDDRKPLSRWLWAQNRYMVIETQKLLETPLRELNWSDRIRRTKILAPSLIFIYCLIFKGGILDGWRGWYYAFQRVLAEILLAIHLIEAKLSKNLI